MKTYYKEYAHKEHGQWLAEHLNITPSPLGIAVANILGYVGGGLYNCPINLKNTDWKHNFCIEVIWEGDLTNWDDSGLSRLWVLCHRKKIRVEIGATIVDSSYLDDDDQHVSSHAPALNLVFHQRESREGGVMDRLPDCEDMIRDIDDDFNNGAIE